MTIEEIESLIHAGKFFQARLSLESRDISNDSRYAQQYALALSKTGVPEKALSILAPFHQSNPNDPETAGILGGIYKELFKKKRTSDLAILSRDTYHNNFNQTKSYYTGINAATMSAIVMQGSKARAIAQEVISLIDPSTMDFWELATLGEAYLLTKQKDRSVAAYLSARKAAGNQWGKITSVYNQLWLLNHYVPVSGDILKIFHPPNVVAFVGHMIDHPNRPTKRFPPEIEANVREAIRSAIRTSNAKVGYCSLACGGDILFAEVLEEEGGELNIMLPFDSQDFINTSIAFAGDNWQERFDKIIEKYGASHITNLYYEGHDDLFSYLVRIIYGSAILRSSLNHTEPSLISVLSETDLNQRTGGTRDAIKGWTFPNRHININPDNYLGINSSLAVAAGSPSTHKATSADRPVLYMFFIQMNKELPSPVMKTLNEKLESILSGAISSPPTMLDRSDKSVLIGATSIITTMEAFHQVQSHLDKQHLEFKSSFHSGPVYLRKGTESNTEMNTIKELGSFGLNGYRYASQMFAAVLTLHPRKYNIEYAGSISQKNMKDIEVYLVG